MSEAADVGAQTGFLGLIFVLVSALSFARALQRLIERIWEQPHRGGVTGARRGIVWLVGWVVYLQLLAVLAQLLTGGDLTVVRLLLQVAFGTLVWWWTAHTLLDNRVPWSSLWYGALITAIGMSVLVRASRLVMPPYVESNVEQFGALGILFAISTWLLVYGAVIVVATVLGRVVAEEPRLRLPPMRGRHAAGGPESAAAHLPQGSQGRRSDAQQS